VEFAQSESKRPTDFSVIKIGLASPETIRSWSYGEVTSPETINYRTFKPERDGLFCERIFGPVKDYECHCGKYKRARYKGVICDRCGVEVTLSKVRRERMGHIELAVPVSHIWYFKSIPSYMGYILDVSIRELERVLYYESYVVIDPGDSGLKEKELLSEAEYLEQREGGKKFVAKIGGEAVRDLLSQIDVEELSAELRAKVKVETSEQQKKTLLKRLRVVEAFRQSENRPEWMILEVLPVISPDLRPLVPLEGGRFATSDLNDLYRRVINRNNRLRKLIEMRAPSVILKNEKRMLQEAVDALLDNGRRTSSVRGTSKRPLRSLSDLLKGKRGRFRQNLLGKRVDYSGRSVIVIGPELKLHQCGLPKTMALELFKPFIISRLEERGLVQTIKSAKKLVEREHPQVWDILEEIIKDHPVLLNRAPTLHRLGIQGFQPVLVEGKAIRIHPLVCAAFNADFDGDQMAVHVPLSFEAQLEAAVLLNSMNNILSPAHGRPLAIPSQDMTLGLYYLTKEGLDGEAKVGIFSNQDEVLVALDAGKLALHNKIKVRIDNQTIVTTPGRVVFNQIVPPQLGYINEPLDKKKMEDIVYRAYRLLGNKETAEFLDKLKEMGFEFATRSGLTVGIDDFLIPQQKYDLIARAFREVEAIQKQYEKGIITDGERYNKVIDAWTRTTNEVAEIMLKELEKDQGGFNPVFMMAHSGARGSKDQIRQLSGMRGLMTKPQRKITGGVGEIIESPITSNFREGLSVLEFFVSTHGARKGLADTALKTADAGYLTRRLVDVAQDVIITEEDCGTILGLRISALKEAEEVIEPLKDRILGRVTLEDVYSPLSGELLVRAGEEIDEEKAEAIEENSIESVMIRSVLTCEARKGVCAKCYGRNLATGRMVERGEAVGVMAAQSIGEPGTQLTLRTFHIGGTAGRIAAQSKISAKWDAQIRFKDLSVVERQGGLVVLNHHGEVDLVDQEGRERGKYTIPYGATLRVRDGDQIEKGDVLFEWDPYSNSILAEEGGTVSFVDLVQDVTVKEELDETTGLRQKVVVEDAEKMLHPHISILDVMKRKLVNYSVPTGSHLMVNDGDKVAAGDALVKIPKEISKTRDITGGLPRVAELFEARKPKSPAVVSEIDGIVKFGKLIRGARQVLVEGENEEVREYLIPQGKHFRVHDGDRVKAGEKLCEGPVDPRDVLRIKGSKAVQEYLVNEVQEVYRLQGVRINDKHVEVIVRQMLRKVRVVDPGDTEFLEGEQVNKFRFQEENERVMGEGGEPATFQPLLLGITKAALSTDSFVSAASFQETTRVLSQAAIMGRRDELLGLKENVIMGHLIPAGTGLERYRRLKVSPKKAEEEAKELEVVEKT
jgi:DNA-directed RNA polymerase subunit beta'